jgi:hypothetical protein
MGKLLLCATVLTGTAAAWDLGACWPVPQRLEAQPSYAAVGVANGHAGSELIAAPLAAATGRAGGR